MLKQRILTAAVLAPLMIAGIFWLPAKPFELFIGFILALAGWEWANLAGFERNLERWAYGALIGLLIALCSFIGPAGYLPALVVAGVFWLGVLGWVRRYPQEQPLWGSRASRAVLGLAVLLPTWSALVALKGQPQSDALLLVLMLIVWGADIGAYFAGRAWGRAKLAPQVSPGKTWAGFYGGLASALLIALLGGWYLGLQGGAWIIWLLVALVSALASVLGDLFESMLKRYRGIKDSSRLLPGHGGVMDRIDSLTAAAPYFALGTYLLGESLY